MFFHSVIEVTTLRNEINRLLRKVFNSVKEMNRLAKEISKLLSKAMSNIYLKVAIETISKFRFSGFKKFVTRSVFGELQLTRILLNFKISCCNLKIRGLETKLCVAFLLF